MKIRNYRKEDYPIILSWWMNTEETLPSANLIPLESSFIVENDDEIPLLAVSLYLTNTNEMCYVQNFIGNPNFKGPIRKQAGELLQKHIEQFAKELNIKRLICYTYKDKIKDRYKELGYQPTYDNITSFVKEIL